ncbi:MAG: HAD-IIIA family hydrolase [Verrucomicrobia bacterium]|nr:HAD-IIIA family hydrolase [Verrucomicrobiota bacterium]
MSKALFLDRDGVLNKVVLRDGKVGSPRTFQEFELIPEAISFVKSAKELGFCTILITNQPDISRKKMTRYQMARMHQKLREEMPIDYIEVCTSSDDACFRRKPNPGMLLESANRYKINLSASFFIGDSIKDIEAGKRANVRTILLKTEYNQNIDGDFNCQSYKEALAILWREPWNLSENT